jgi:hypothetical protein
LREGPKTDLHERINCDLECDFIPLGVNARGAPWRSPNVPTHSSSGPPPNSTHSATTAGSAMRTEKNKIRGIITPHEINALFNKNALLSIWKCERVFFVASLLGVATGLRQGEVRGLPNQDVHQDYVAVCGSWEERNGLHGAKWGSERSSRYHSASPMNLICSRRV